MAEYIDKEATIKRFEEIKQSGVSFKDVIFLDGAIAVVENIPAADIAPVVHGKWVDNGIEGSMLSGCSVCGFSCGAYSFRYCPSCGAKMDLEEDDG